MTGVRLDLPNPASCESPREYIEKHLAPALTELHRITNELLTPGASSAEEWAVDMVPALGSTTFRRFERPFMVWAKHVTFDGSTYFTLPKELLRSKQAKVQFTALVYSSQAGEEAEFRLVDSSGDELTNSVFKTTSGTPVAITRILPFGEPKGSIHPSNQTYFIEGRSLNGKTAPVCRRFSLSFVFI